MARRLPAALAVLVVAGPAAVGLADGGYPEVARRVAGVVACLAVVALAVTGRLPRPRLALAGVAALAALTALSLLWAPLLAPAHADAERLVLYLAALVLAAGALRGRRSHVEPGLALGALVVVLLGLSERLVPWLVELERSVAAGGRLVQPLGYWNAMGALAAMGLVLCAGLAADGRRGDGLRAAAAAGSPAFGAALALTVSRGAIGVFGAGLVVLLALRPAHETLRAVLIAVELATGAALAALALPAVRTLEGARDAQGAVLLAVLVLAAGLAALAQRHAARAERDGRLRTGPLLRRPRRGLAAAAAAVVAALGVVAAVVATDRAPRTGTPEFGADPSRLVSAQSTRYDYWRAALGTFADHPVAGRGASGFRVEWLARRSVAEPARDAHSLPLETAAELGLLGLAALALLVVGGVAVARRGAATHPAAVAALAAFAAHACVDWAWELPGISLFALALLGLLLAEAEAQAGAG